MLDHPFADGERSSPSILQRQPAARLHDMRLVGMWMGQDDGIGIDADDAPHAPLEIADHPTEAAAFIETRAAACAEVEHDGIRVHGALTRV